MIGTIEKRSSRSSRYRSTDSVAMQGRRGREARQDYNGRPGVRDCRCRQTQVFNTGRDQAVLHVNLIDPDAGQLHTETYCYCHTSIQSRIRHDPLKHLSETKHRLESVRSRLSSRRELGSPSDDKLTTALWTRRNHL